MTQVPSAYGYRYYREGNTAYTRNAYTRTVEPVDYGVQTTTYSGGERGYAADTTQTTAFTLRFACVCVCVFVCVSLSLSTSGNR